MNKGASLCLIVGSECHSEHHLVLKSSLRKNQHGLSTPGILNEGITLHFCSSKVLYTYTLSWGDHVNTIPGMTVRAKAAVCTSTSWLTARANAAACTTTTWLNRSAPFFGSNEVLNCSCIYACRLGGVLKQSELQLLTGMLYLDPRKRWTASRCLQHCLRRFATDALSAKQ